IDPLASTALIYDYKGASAEPAAKWGQRGCLQPALYMLAVEQLLGTEGVGGLYQPLRTAELRPRGAIRADVEPTAPLFENDRLAPRGGGGGRGRALRRRAGATTGQLHARRRLPLSRDLPL